MMQSESNATILLIDDAPEAILVAAKQLSGLGELLAATCGADGLRLARQAQPDLILLDARMPDMDGLAVLAQLKADTATRDIPVIMVSADGGGAHCAAALAAGAADFVCKPPEPDVFRAHVLAQLQRRPAGT
ncbi:MAG: response regulator [Rhodocyclaceae bacterium]|nr:response regulator [Rhodocyclaceae bacterium]